MRQIGRHGPNACAGAALSSLPAEIEDGRHTGEVWENDYIRVAWQRKPERGSGH